MIVPLADLVSCLESGARPKGGAAADLGNIPSLGGEHIGTDGRCDLTKRKTIPEAFFRSMRSGHIERNDILIVKDGATTGKVAFVDTTFPEIEAAVNEHVFRLKVDTKRADPAYVFHFLFADIGQREILKDFRGSTVGGIGRTFVDKVRIPLPPLEEQRRVAAILDQADELRRKRQRALDRLNQLGQAIFIEMFGDPTASGRTSLAEVLTASSNGMNVEQSNSGVGVPVTRIETIWNGTIDSARVRWADVDSKSSERFFLRDGDILFSHINSPEHIGKTAIYMGNPRPLLHGINLLRLQPDRSKTSPMWLLHLLKSRSVRAYFRNRCKKAVNQASLNKNDLAALCFAVPDISEQRAFAARVFHIWEHVPILESAVRKQSELFASLQHHAFRGELSASSLQEAAV